MLSARLRPARPLQWSETLHGADGDTCNTTYKDSKGRRDHTYFYKSGDADEVLRDFYNVCTASRPVQSIPLPVLCLTPRADNLSN